MLNEEMLDGEDSKLLEIYRRLIDGIPDRLKNDAYAAEEMIFNQDPIANAPIFFLVLELFSEVRELRKSNDNLANLLADKINE